MDMRLSQQSVFGGKMSRPISLKLAVVDNVKKPRGGVGCHLVIKRDRASLHLLTRKIICRMYQLSGRDATTGFLTQ